MRLNKGQKAKFAKLISRYPALGELDKAVKLVRDNPKVSARFCANEIWYGYGPLGKSGFKSRVERIVGWDSPHPELQASEIYDLVYDGLYGQLPDCRNCLCA
jgi:hypothetical protein